MKFLTDTVQWLFPEVRGQSTVPLVTFLMVTVFVFAAAAAVRFLDLLMFIVFDGDPWAPSIAVFCGASFLALILLAKAVDRLNNR